MMHDDNSTVGESSAWAEIPMKEYKYADDFKAGGTRRKITILVRRLPENVYLAVSDDMPGMTVEGRTRDEVAEESMEAAKNLLELSGDHVERGELGFVFVFL